MVFLKEICIEDKKIEAVKQWPEPQLIQDIQVFLGFANFYQQFIQGFCQIAALLSLILKTLGSTESIIQYEKGIIGIGVDSRAGYNGSRLDRSKLD